MTVCGNSASRTRIEYEPKESPQASAARWCFERGVNPDRLVSAGLPPSVVSRAVDDVLGKIRGVPAQDQSKPSSVVQVATSPRFLVERCRLAHRFRMLGDTWQELATRLDVSKDLARSMATAGSQGRKLKASYLLEIGLAEAYEQHQATLESEELI